MTTEWIIRLTQCLVLLLVQVLFLNHIHLFGLAIPLLYVFFAITFRRGFPKWIMLLSCFLLGLVIDIFSSTPGLAAGCMTLVAFVQPYVLETVVPRDSAADLEVSLKSLGTNKFCFLSSVITVFFCLLFFAVEAFSFFDWLVWLERAFTSAVLTWILMMAIESVRSR